MERTPLTPFRSGGLLVAADPFLALHRDMNRLFDDVLRGSGGGQEAGGAGTVLNAQTNVSETDKEIRITAELPGVTEQDIDLSVHNDVLTIRAEKKFERVQDDEKVNFHFVERSYGTFQRSLRLPYAVDASHVQAKFENGVLTVTLPKTTHQERSRKIQIQGASGRTEGATTGGACA